MNTQVLQEELQRHLGYLAQDSDNWNLLVTISGYYYQLNDLELSQRYLDDAKKLTGHGFWDLQGMLYLNARKLPEARLNLETALRTQETVKNRYQLSFCLYLSGEFAKALEIINALLPEQRFQYSELLRAKILLHLRRAKEAMVLLEQLYVQHPSEADIAGLLSLLYFDTNQIKKAEKFCNQALTLEADNTDAVLVNILLKTLQGKATIDEIELQLTITPQESRLWCALGTTQMRLMNVVAAEQSYSKATEICPDLYDGWVNLAWCCLLQNKLDSAKDAYLKAIDIYADHADSWAGLALINAMQNDMITAQQWLDKARLLDENCSLLVMVEIIMNNKVNPDMAAVQLNKAFPEIGEEIRQMLSQAILMDDSVEKVVH